MLDSDVRIGDPIRIYVGLINVSDRSVRTVARFDIGGGLDIDVVNEQGDEQDFPDVEPGYYAEYYDIRSSNIMIPRGGVFGRVLDLKCDKGAYGAKELPCHVALSLDRPGTYQITMHYWALCGFRECPYGRPWETEKLTAAAVTLRLLP